MATIIVGFDGRHGHRALECAAELAGGDDRLLVVGAVEPTWTGNGFRFDPVELEERSRSLDEARRILFRLGHGARTTVARGHESVALAVAAAENDARLIVAGRPRTLGQRLRLALGIPSLERIAPCPVVRAF